MRHEWWGWSINYYACVTDISCSDLFSFSSAKRLRGWEYMCWHVRVNFMYAEDKNYPNYENNNNISIKWWFGKNLLHHWRKSIYSCIRQVFNLKCFSWEFRARKALQGSFFIGLSLSVTILCSKGGGGLLLYFIAQ